MSLIPRLPNEIWCMIFDWRRRLIYRSIYFKVKKTDDRYDLDHLKEFCFEIKRMEWHMNGTYIILSSLRFKHRMIIKDKKIIKHGRKFHTGCGINIEDGVKDLMWNDGNYFRKYCSH